MSCDGLGKDSRQLIIWVWVESHPIASFEPIKSIVKNPQTHPEPDRSDVTLRPGPEYPPQPQNRKMIKARTGNQVWGRWTNLYYKTRFHSQTRGAPLRSRLDHALALSFSPSLDGERSTQPQIPVSTLFSWGLGEEATWWLESCLISEKLFWQVLGACVLWRSWKNSCQLIIRVWVESHPIPSFELSPPFCSLYWNYSLAVR